MYFLKKGKTDGFTLPELIIVVAILGILAAIAVPRVIKVQGKAEEKADKATITGVETAVELYLANEETIAEVVKSETGEATAENFNNLITELYETDYLKETSYTPAQQGQEFTYDPTKQVVGIQETT